MEIKKENGERKRKKKKIRRTRKNSGEKCAKVVNAF